MSIVTHQLAAQIPFRVFKEHELFIKDSGAITFLEPGKNAVNAVVKSFDDAVTLRKHIGMPYSTYDIETGEYELFERPEPTCAGCPTGLPLETVPTQSKES